MINIVVPMAGRGSRFANAGYELPKPLIDVGGRPMIDIVIDNIKAKLEHRFIFLCLQEHLDKYDLEVHLKNKCPNCIVVPVKHVTEGAACTVLLAEKYIDNEDSLMIANSDQYVEGCNIDKYINSIGNADGLIMTMKANDAKWSFIKYDNNKNVFLVKEKEVISDEATVGIYNFAHGSDFVLYAKRMIEQNIRVNGEFYVAPVYNMFIEDGKKIVFYNVGNVESGMYGLGTPKDLELFKKMKGIY